MVLMEQSAMQSDERLPIYNVSLQSHRHPRANLSIVLPTMI